jgi:hypothetical protein
LKRTAFKSPIPFFRPADALLILLIGLAAFRGFRPETGSPAGNRILVSVDGISKMTIPLKADTVVTIRGMRGNTEIEISNGRARILRSPCPGKNCMHQGRIHNPGRMLICIPNRVTVTVEGTGSRGSELDGLTP